MDSDFFFRLIEQVNLKLDELSRSSELVKSEVSAIKTRLFNGLTDKFHPTQVLADVMTMREHSEKPIQQISFAYVGDTRNNMGHSLLLAGCLMGMDVRICGPEKLWPADDVVALGRDLEKKTGARCRFVSPAAISSW